MGVILSEAKDPDREEAYYVRAEILRSAQLTRDLDPFPAYLPEICHPKVLLE